MSGSSTKKIRPESAFKTEIRRAGPWMVIHLPEEESRKFPSRGIACADGTVNGAPFRTVLEPDGRGGHWFRITEELQSRHRLNLGDTVELVFRQSDNWPEPEIPVDVISALENSPGARSVWERTTPIARWDWLRWIRSTKNPETRKRRIDAACDKLNRGEKRPCCFNRTSCTDPTVSRGGKLILQD